MAISELTVWSTTLVLAGAALLVPYISAIVRRKYFSPRLDSEFELGPPYCHLTERKMFERLEGGAVRIVNGFPAYYCRFAVVNNGRLQADDCEAILEKVWKQDSAGNFIEWQNFSPVTLKWSGPTIFLRAIQPKRRVYCDIGRVHHPQHEDVSMYRGITEAEKKKNKFFFEIKEKFFVQWDCLVPGRYRIQISIYAKNAPPITRRFDISWSGEWSDTEEEMFRELVISPA